LVDFKSPYGDQIKEVNEIILKTGIFSNIVIKAQIKEFYLDLNMHTLYFDLNHSEIVFFKKRLQDIF
jgi:hypothetical protein